MAIWALIRGWWRARQRAIDLKITGNVHAGNMSGGGKLFLSEDRKSITGLKLEMLNKITNLTIKADFVAK